MTREMQYLCRVLAASIGLGTLAAMPCAVAGPPEVFYAPGGITGLLHVPDVAAAVPAVLLVHDALGLDRRSERYIAQFKAAGLLVLEVELRANPLDGSAEPLPGALEGAEQVASAALALAHDPRVVPGRIGALGLGIGARAVALAAAQEDGVKILVARLLLYPGCASLTELVRATPRATAYASSPVLILHGEGDPANTPCACSELATALGSSAAVSRTAYAGATYAWDLPQTAGSAIAGQPWPGGEGSVAARSWPELAELTATRAAAFLAGALQARSARSD